MKCPGLPYHECGRLLIGGIKPECIVHGALEDVEARWERYRVPVARTVDAPTPVVVKPKEFALALQGELFA
jgi:hypothetical protein